MPRAASSRRVSSQSLLAPPAALAAAISCRLMVKPWSASTAITVSR